VHTALLHTDGMGGTCKTIKTAGISRGCRLDNPISSFNIVLINQLIISSTCNRVLGTAYSVPDSQVRYFVSNHFVENNH